MRDKEKVKAVPSILKTRGTKECEERATAELSVPDPTPEKAKAFIEQDKDQE